MAPVQQSSFRQNLRRAILAVVVAVLLLYPLDWLVWRLRLMAGSGMGSARVIATTAATLKGNRFEIYSQNTQRR